MALSNEIITFAAGNTEFYEKFAKYYNNQDKVTQEHRDEIHNLFFSEIERRSGVARTAENANAWAANPMVQWACYSVIDATVNSILPQTLNSSIGVFTDLRFTSYGDIVKFRVKPRTLFTVSKGGHGERTSFRQKKYDGDVVVAPVEHIVTTYVDMYRVLAGKEDIAEFVRLVIMSIETEMGKDAAAALNAGLTAATYPSELKVTGAFSAENLIQLGETVQAYNYGMRPVILGTSAALAKVTPDSALGFRGNWDASNGTVHVMKDFYGFTLMVLPQFAAGSNPAAGLALPDNVLYVISPNSDKLVKAVVSQSLTNSNNFYDNADLTQNFTMRKEWGMEFIGAAWGGTYTISD